MSLVVCLISLLREVRFRKKKKNYEVCADIDTIQGS